MIQTVIFEDELIIIRKSKSITRDQLMDELNKRNMKLVNWLEIEPIALCDWCDMVQHIPTGDLYKFGNWMIRGLDDELNLYGEVTLPLIEFEESI